MVAQEQSFAMAEPFITIRRGSQYSEGGDSNGAQLSSSHDIPQPIQTSAPSTLHQASHPTAGEDCSDDDDGAKFNHRPRRFAAKGHLNTEGSNSRTPRPPGPYHPPVHQKALSNNFMPPFSNLQGSNNRSSSNSPPSPTAIVSLVPLSNGEPPIPEHFSHHPDSPVEGMRRIKPHRQRKSSFIAPPSPAAQSYSSVPSSLQSDVFSQDRRPSDSHRSWSPDQSMQGPSPYPPMIKPNPPDQQSLEPFSSGWPASPGASNHHMQPPFLGPGPGPGPNGPNGSMMPGPMPHQGPHELQHGNPPVSGYEKIALHLTGEMGNTRVYPIYRRFATLNHRLLLHIQDELAVLEEDLGRLDYDDACDRTQHNHVRPASRREEGERGVVRDELMKQVGFKLEQYRQILAAFNEMQQYSRPTHEDIDGYKELLARDGGPIVENEASFIHQESDLLCFDTYSAEEPGHMMLKEVSGMPPSPVQSDITTRTTKSKHGNDPLKLKRMAYLRSRTILSAAYVTIAAILAPILTFFVIPSFLGRMLIVIVAMGGVSAALMTSGMLRGSDETVVRDCIICAGVYGGIMIVLAGIC